MNNIEKIARALLDRVSETRARHLRSGFHESHPCGGCHFWSGYEAALRDVLSRQLPTNTTLNHKRAWATPERGEWRGGFVESKANKS